MTVLSQLQSPGRNDGGRLSYDYYDHDKRKGVHGTIALGLVNAFMSSLPALLLFAVYWIVVHCDREW